MKITDIISLAAKGVKVDQLKEINADANSEALIELMKAGLSFKDAREAASLADEPTEAPAETSPADEGEKPADDPNEWEVKYKKLLEEKQLEKQRENNLHGDEEAEKQKRLEDMARRFM